MRFGDGVSIHAPREGRDLNTQGTPRTMPVFQSTRPVKGATCHAFLIASESVRFNPRAP